MSQWKASWRAAGGQGGNPWHVGSCAPVIVSVNWGGGGTPEGEGEREGGGAGGRREVGRVGREGRSKWLTGDDDGSRRRKRRR